MTGAKRRRAKYIYEKQLLSRIALFLAVKTEKAAFAFFSGFSTVGSSIPKYSALLTERMKSPPTRGHCPPITIESAQAHSPLGQSGNAKGAGPALLMAVCPRLLTAALASTRDAHMYSRVKYSTPVRSWDPVLTHRQGGALHFRSHCSARGPLHLLSPASVLSHSHPPSSTRKWGATACHRLL